MNNFKVGVNFDFELLNKIIELNKEQTNSKITELYGSIRQHSELAARPDFRLPDIELKDLEEYIKVAKYNNIDFNYTLNSIIPYGSKEEINKNINNIVNLINYLESIGVYRITVSNPILLEIIRRYAKSKIEIEISTIAHIDTITQIKYFHEYYGVNKVCGNLNKNRNFEFLKNAADYCKKNEIIYELMVNEFCGVGGDNYATHCVYRDSCYICHAVNHTYEDTETLNNYPMNLCTNSRNRNISNWLKLRWIRPEDLKFYNKVGINHFKITGRTGSTEYILKTLKAYMQCKYQGNLIELWKPLESIKPGVEEATVKNFYINNNYLDGFILPWVNGKNCDYEVCGETCNYCNNFYKAIKMEESLDV